MSDIDNVDNVADEAVNVDNVDNVADEADEAVKVEPDDLGTLVAISDAGGFLGAFLTLGEANTKVIQKYPLVPLLVQRYRLSPGPLTHVWAVPIRDSQALAIVSNSRDEADRVRRAYCLVGLAYGDSVDYWKIPMGQLVPAAEERLESMRRAHAMYASGAIEAECAKNSELEEKLQEAIMSRRAALAQDGPIAQMLRENARIGFLDCVVDVGYEDEDDADADAGADAGADADADAGVDAEYDKCAVSTVPAEK